MGNMSYCRFQNTSADLRDCIHALEDIVNNDEELPSQDELDAMETMTVQCRRFLALFLELQSLGADRTSSHPDAERDEEELTDC